MKHHPWAKLLNYRTFCRMLINQFYLKNKTKKVPCTLQQPLLNKALLNLPLSPPPHTFQLCFYFFAEVLTRYPSEFCVLIVSSRWKAPSLCWFLYPRRGSVQYTSQDRENTFSERKMLCWIPVFCILMLTRR